MNPDRRFDRRAFLWRILAGLGTAVPAIGHGAGPRIAPSWRPPAMRIDLREVLERHFGDADLSAAAELGRIGIMMRTGGDQALWSRVTGTLEVIAGSTGVDDALERLDRAVRGDFEQLRLESLHGWQLARTELDLCVAAWWLYASADEAL